MTTDGTTLTKTAKEKAQVMNEYLTSVFTKESDNLSNPSKPSIKKPKELKTHKSPGPDSVHPRILKELCNVLSLPLYLIINSSFTSNSFPIEWKLANIFPILKCSKSLPSKYRPVSLTSIISKIAEHFVRETIMQLMKINKLFSNK